MSGVNCTRTFFSVIHSPDKISWCVFNKKNCIQTRKICASNKAPLCAPRGFGNIIVANITLI